jgi:hypothetical protein
MSISTESSVNYGTVSSSPPESIPENDVDMPKYSHDNDELSPLHTFVVILSLAGITFSASVSTGLLTLGLPTIANDLQIPDNLMIWCVRSGLNYRREVRRLSTNNLLDGNT